MMNEVDARYLVYYFHLHLYAPVLLFGLPTATHSPWVEVPL